MENKTLSPPNEFLKLGTNQNEAESHANYKANYLASANQVKCNKKISTLEEVYPSER